MCVHFLSSGIKWLRSLSVFNERSLIPRALAVMAVPAHEAFCTDLQKPRGCHQTFKSAALQSTLAQPWHRGYGKLWQAIAANHSNGDHVETVIELRFAPSSQQQLPSFDSAVTCCGWIRDPRQKSYVFKEKHRKIAKNDIAAKAKPTSTHEKGCVGKTNMV